MSNNIWNNPLMWQNKSSNVSDDDFTFEFDDSGNLDFDAEFSEGYSDFKQEASLVDSAAKAGAYTESTPQMAGGGSAASLDKELDSVFNTETASQTKSQSYNLDIVFGDDSASELPSLQTLIATPTSSQSNSYQFNDDDDSQIILIEKLGITTDSVFDKGVSIGLSPLDVANNLDTLRQAMTLEILTGDNLNAQELTELYQASVNGDNIAVEIILNNNNVHLDGTVSTQDIMALSQNANNKIFKSAYLN